MQMIVFPPSREFNHAIKLETLSLPPVGAKLVVPTGQTWIVTNIVLDWMGSSKYPEIRVYTKEIYE